MLDIPKVSRRIQKMLDQAGWTLQKLADAKPEQLTVIEGIGNTTAWRIIVYARRQTREARAEIPVVIDDRWLTQPEPPRGIYIAPPAKPDPPGLAEMSVDDMLARFRELAPGEEIPEMSVRVKRNWLRSRLRELWV